MPDHKKHIFLTGFMGSGKSTLGRKLSFVLKLNFIDLDSYIEQREGRTIAAIFEQDNETAFRTIESDSLQELILKQEPMVIALGGGTICFGNNLEKVKARGLLVYIKLPADILAERIRNSAHKRPLLQNIKREDLVQNIDNKLSEREAFYSQAHLTLQEPNLTAPILKARIIAFKENNSY